MSELEAEFITIFDAYNSRGVGLFGCTLFAEYLMATSFASGCWNYMEKTP